MAVMYDPKPGAFMTEGLSLTEQEHLDSCDINKMMRSLARGQQVRMGNKPVFGYDDTTVEPVTLRIQKQKVEDHLRALAESGEISEDEVKHIPDSIRKKFDFKTSKKAAKKPAAKNDELNDEKPAVSKAAPVSDQVDDPS